MRVDTSEGFELCPADACRVDDAFRPAGEKPPGLFTVMTDFEHPLVERYAGFLAANGIEIAGMEFILDSNGVAYTYDINTNTNYNAQGEAEAGVPGMGIGAIADFLCRELARITPLHLPCAAAE